MRNVFTTYITSAKQNMDVCLKKVFATTTILFILVLLAKDSNAQLCSELVRETFTRGSVPTGWVATSLGTYTAGSNGTAGYIRMNGVNDAIRTPLLTTPGNLTFMYARNSTTTAWNVAVEVSSNGTAWTTVTTLTNATLAPTTSFKTSPVVDLSAYSNVYVRLRDARASGTPERYITNLIITDRTNTSLTFCNNNDQTISCGTTYTFYDYGGLGDYITGATTTGTTYTSVFTPSVAGNKVRITFNSFDVEPSTCAQNWDWLRIHNGNSTAAAALHPACTGTAPIAGFRNTAAPMTVPQTFTSTAANGSLTFQFKTDGATIATGWVATVECFNPCTAPTALSYTNNTAVYCRNLAISNNIPSYSGTTTGATFSVSPALPAGLSLNTSNGTISGTPTTAQAAANYTVTVTNGCGNTPRVLSIAVNAPPTANAGSNVSVARGTPAAITGASYTGATGVSWTSNVAGTFSPNNTTLNPTWLPNDPTWTGNATLTMTTTGAAPCTNISSNITVTVTVPAICPGANTGSATFNAGGGGGTSSYEVSINDGSTYNPYTPGAPINTTGATGSVKIRTTQTVSGCTNSAIHTLWTIRTDCCNQPTVTATTAASSIGCTTTSTGGNITLAVTDPCTFVERGVVYAITATPTIANSKVAVAGTSGAFAANLTGLSNGTLYYVRAYATSSSGTVYGPEITFTTLASPSNLNYGTNTYSFCTGTSVGTLTPTFTGAAATSYSVSPALPAGLTLNTSTGVITGTPSVTVAATNYTVTVNNACSSTTRAVNITVNQPPTNLNYTSNTVSYCTGSAITANNPTFTGSAATSYSVSPALPTGLTLNTSTGVITGTPTVAATAANYTVTVNNACSSTTRAVNITVTTTPTAGINPATVAICNGENATLTATGGGTYIWSNSGGTAAGATFSPATSTTYTVTVTSGICSSTASRLVTVNAVPSAPIVGTITPPSCGSSTGSVALSGLPASGTWTLTRNPGGTTTTGTGTSTTVSSIPANATYTYTVTSAEGCTSAASGNVAIPAAPAIPGLPVPVVSYTCSNGTVSMSGGTLGANEVFRWYNAPSAGTIVSTANPYAPSLTHTTNYYVSRYNTVSTCESVRVPVVATKQGLDAYTATRNTGITFTNIASTGTAVTSWRNGSSNGNLSNNVNIGFSFPFDGSNHTQFRVGLNGFIAFNTSSNANGDALVACGNGDAYSGDNFNTFTRAGAKGSLQTIAPFYDNLERNGSFALNATVHHQVTGTAPNRILTVQWRGLSRSVSSNCSSPCSYGNYNFQVKLYEANGNIEFVYGTMSTGSDENSKRYSCGLNSASLATPLNTSKLFTQQTANTATFSSNPVNNLRTCP